MNLDLEVCLEDCLKVCEEAFYAAMRRGGSPRSVYFNTVTGDCRLSQYSCLYYDNEIKIADYPYDGYRYSYSAEDLADLGLTEDRALWDDWHEEFLPLEREHLENLLEGVMQPQ